MPHHQEILPTVVMVIPVHVMTIHQEATVREGAMVTIVTIQILQVAAPTGIHRTVMETHPAPATGGPLSSPGGSSAIMATAAHLANVVGVQLLRQPR